MGLKDVVVLAYERRGPDVELMIEQVTGDLCRPAYQEPAQVKERPVVHYVDLPVYGTAMSLAWKKHRMRCVKEACPKGTWVLEDQGSQPRTASSRRGRPSGHSPSRWGSHGLRGGGRAGL